MLFELSRTTVAQALPVDDLADLVVLDHLVGEQALGDLVEKVAVVGQQAVGPSVGLLGDRLHLLVTRAAQRLGDGEVIGRDLMGADRGAHRVLVDHRARDFGDPLQVIGCAGGDATECHLLRYPPREQHLHVVDQLLARLQVAILLREVQGVAERLAPGHYRDLLDLVDRGQELRDQRVPGLVPGDHALLVGCDHLPGLQAGDHAFEGVVEVGLGDLVAVAATGQDRRLVGEVGQVRARQPGGVTRHPLQVHVVAQRLVMRVHAEDPLAPAHVGRRHEDLAVEAPGAQQRAVELLEHVRRGHHDHVVAGVEAVHLDQELIQRLVALPRDIRAAMGADRVELVDEDDRRGILAGLLEQSPDPRGPQAGEHLHERGGRLAEEVGARLVSDGLGEQGLAGAGRAVQQDALRHRCAQPLELLRPP